MYSAQELADFLARLKGMKLPATFEARSDVQKLHVLAAQDCVIAKFTAPSKSRSSYGSRFAVLMSIIQ